MAVDSAQEGNRGKDLAPILRCPLSCLGWMRRRDTTPSRRQSQEQGVGQDQESRQEGAHHSILRC